MAKAAVKSTKQIIESLYTLQLIDSKIDEIQIMRGELERRCGGRDSTTCTQGAILIFWRMGDGGNAILSI